MKCIVRYSIMYCSMSCFCDFSILLCPRVLLMVYGVWCMVSHILRSTCNLVLPGGEASTTGVYVRILRLGVAVSGGLGREHGGGLHAPRRQCQPPTKGPDGVKHEGTRYAFPAFLVAPSCFALPCTIDTPCMYVCIVNRVRLPILLVVS